MKTPIKPNTFNILQLLLKMKRDKWFLNSPSKWNMLKGLKNINDWYLILTFPMAIFLKIHVHYRHELVFFWRFCNPNDGIYIYIYYICIFISKFNQNNLYILKAYLFGVIWACYKFLQLKRMNRDGVREYTVDPDSEVKYSLKKTWQGTL